jgi:hypothetical protein
MFGSVINKVITSVKLKKRNYDPEMIAADDIKLPLVFNGMEKGIINPSIKTELQTYKLLGYRFKKDFELNVLEYNAYQIGLLIRAIKIGADLKVNKPKNYFHKNIFEHENRTITAFVIDIIKKYEKIIKITLSVTSLKKENIFTPLEAGYLLYYLSFYIHDKKYKI